MTRIRTVTAVAALVTASVLPVAALAHWFAVAVVAPLSGPEAERGNRMLAGFLVATRERDAHPAETSDGHLGGLDSHVFEVDSSAGSEHVARRLREIDASRPIAFIVGLRADEVPELPALGPAGRSITIVDPGLGAGYAEAMRRPDRLRTMDGGSFADAFRGAHGTEPDADAARGYLAARLIDQVVRTVHGDLDRPEAVSAALADAMASRW